MRSVVVFCGSSLGNDIYVEAAKGLALALVESDISIVYGGGKAGLMGVIASTAMDHGGRVSGVIPEFLNVKEIENDNLTELHKVGDMHERKKRMTQLADAAIVLPGAFGTMEEMFEVASWTQLGCHHENKAMPVGILNVNGFYDHLIAHLDVPVREGFLSQDTRSIVISDRNPERLIKRLKEWRPLHKCFVQPKSA